MNEVTLIVDSEELSRQGLKLLGMFLGNDCVVQELQPHIKTCTTNKGGKETVLTSYAWSRAGYPWIRLSEIKNAQGTFIYNLAALPDPRVCAPMIQAEIVVLRSKLFLIILELSLMGKSQPATTPTFHEFLTQLTTKYSDQLPPVTERMAWAEGVIDEDAFWSKPNTTESIPAGFQALEEFFRFLERVQSEFAVSSEPDEAIASKEHLIKMAEKFNANGPSKPFLETFFGKEWTEQYLVEFFFPVELLKSLPV